MDTLSRFSTARRIARLLHRPADLSAWPLAASTFPELDVDAIVDDLDVQGFHAGLRLPDWALQGLTAYAHEGLCFADARPQLGFRYRDRARAEAALGRQFSLASYLFPDEAQHLLDHIVTDPLLLHIAARHLGCAPVMTGTRLWWTFPADPDSYDKSLTTSFFHYDKDGYSALRLFFYLTPVDRSGGPHVVVRGSHRSKPLRQLVSLGERTDADIEATYGARDLVTICGDAGTGFAEDPYCFHKATRPESRDRLLLEVKYAAHDYRAFAAADRSSIARILPDPIQ